MGSSCFENNKVILASQINLYLVAFPTLDLN